jgi:hypothetical protein
MRSFSWQWLWVFITLLFCSMAHADITVRDGAPDGFETLAAPRQTIVTLYYGGDMLGPLPAHFSPGKLSFDDPAAVLDKLPNVTDRAKLSNVLSQPMAAHADLLCTTRRTEECGTLAPDIAGVIFNEATLTAELFINPAYLNLSDQNAARYLPLPEQNLSSVATFSGAVNGANGQSVGYTLTNATIVSLGEAQLNTQTTAAQSGLRFDTAAASVERNGWQAAGGLFRSHPMQLLSDRDMAGVSYSTSMKTRLDSQKSRGNDIIVYLPRRSYVSIYREGRLFSSQAYEAGNQRLDTSELPDGAYEITLRIQDSDGTMHDERRFFAKSQEIPAPDQPTYYVDAGLIRKPAGADSTVPEVTAKPIFRAGAIERISDNAAMSFSALGVEDRAIAETGAFWLGPGMKLGATALTSSRGDLGVQASYIQTIGDFNAAIDARKTWMNHVPIPGFEDLSSDITQVSATLNYALTADIGFGVRASYAKENGQVASSIGPYSEWRIWNAGEASLGLTVAAAHTDHQNQASALLHFSYSFGDYNVSGAGGVSRDGTRTGPVGNLRLMHTDNTPGNALTLGGGISTGNGQQVVNSDAAWQNDFGQVRGSVQQAFGDRNSSFGYGGSFAFNASQLEDEIHIGGDQTGKSAVIIETDGDAETVMKIFVNNVERSAVKVGGKQLLYLSPFHTYDIRLAPRQNALLDYDSNARRITLYPGNVTRLHWSINTFYVVSARIVTPDRAPLVDGVLKESRAQVITDGHGRLQAELAASKSLTFTKSDGQACQVDLPAEVKPVNGVLLYREALVCQALTETASR